MVMLMMITPMRMVMEVTAAMNLDTGLQELPTRAKGHGTKNPQLVRLISALRTSTRIPFQRLRSPRRQVSSSESDPQMQAKPKTIPLRPQEPTSPLHSLSKSVFQQHSTPTPIYNHQFFPLPSQRVMSPPAAQISSVAALAVRLATELSLSSLAQGLPHSIQAVVHSPSSRN